MTQTQIIAKCDEDRHRKETGQGLLPSTLTWLTAKRKKGEFALLDSENRKAEEEGTHGPKSATGEEIKIPAKTVLKFRVPKQRRTLSWSASKEVKSATKRHKLHRKHFLCFGAFLWLINGISTLWIAAVRTAAVSPGRPERTQRGTA